MTDPIKDLYESFRNPHPKEVFFPALPTNRRMLLWYADRMVKPDSRIEGLENLQAADSLRRQKKALTFISNHLTYADSHVIEVLLKRFGMSKLAAHFIHIAGQKTFKIYRRPFTRSLNTIRVYQAKANIDGLFKKKMNSRALKWAAHLQRRGYSLLVFPEGTRTRLHRRFNLAHANPKTTLYFRNSHVVPLGLMGPEEILPLGKINPRPARVELRVGKPLEHAKVDEQLRSERPNLSERELRQAAMHHYMKQINDLLRPEYQYQS